MSTAVLAAAALLVLYSSSELGLKTCTSALKSSNSASEPSEEMEAISHDPSSTFVRMQRKISSIGLVGCLFPTRSGGTSTRPLRGFKRRQRETSTSMTDNEKPKYVHTPQYAAESHARTTTPIPFSMRPLSQDVTIQPVKAPTLNPFNMRPMSSEITIQPAKANAHLMEQEQAKNLASLGGRVHIVGASAH